MSNQTPKSGKKGNKGLLWLIGLLIIAIGIVGYMLTETRGTVSNLEEEKTFLLADLEEEERKLLEAQAAHGEYQEEKEAQIEKLHLMMDSVKNLHDGDKKRLLKYQRDYRSMRNQNRDLLAHIDSLNQANALLTAQNDTLEKNLVVEQARSENLNLQNQELQSDIDRGKQLHITRIDAGAYKVRSNGSEKETSKASKTARIKTCYTIGRNVLADKGEKLVYMRVTTPDNRVLVGKELEEKSISVDEKDLLISSSLKIWYEKEPLEGCMHLDVPEVEEDLPEGEYTVQIYTEGLKIGEAKFSLN